jgi:hypothetical protein
MDADRLPPTLSQTDAVNYLALPAPVKYEDIQREVMSE